MIAWFVFAAWAIDAEAERLVDELEAYVRADKWNAVDDQYRRLLAAHPEVLTPELHRLGAQSARLEGDLLLAAQRLQRVDPKAPDYAPVKADLGALSSNTGLVMVRARQGFAPVVMPFAPEMRKAVDLAVSRVAKDGVFVGLLPVGEYTIDGEKRAVQPGFSWQVLMR